MRAERMNALNDRIAAFYDRSSGLWEKTWGEHMHHGYYGPNGDQAKDHRQAQVDLIEALLHWGGINACRNFLDMGCGIGGSTLYLAHKFKASGTGITLSPFQCQRARERADSAGLGDRVSFELGDAHYPPCKAGSFDLVWSLESGEHMADKSRFLSACYQMLAPGGKLLMATWCHRPGPPLNREEQRLLDHIYRDYHLPHILSIDGYQAIAGEIGFEHLEIDDWTPAVQPFWPAVVRSALTLRSLAGLAKAGWPTIKGALAMCHMIRGYKTGLLRFGILKGERP